MVPLGGCPVLARLQQHGQEPTRPSVRKFWGTCPKSPHICNPGRPTHGTASPSRPPSVLLLNTLPCCPSPCGSFPGVSRRWHLRQGRTQSSPGLAWDGIRHQEPHKQQASGKGREGGGPPGPSGQNSACSHPRTDRSRCF